MKIYRQLVKFLKERIPAKYAVSVRRVPLSDYLDGDCQFKLNKFLIRINRLIPEHEAIDVLIHEWAHVIAWEKCPNDDHCDEWGKSYSRIYRIFLKEFLDKKRT